MTTEFANIPLHQIVPSLTNPRKSFNAAKLAELAEDIQRRGIDTPVTVRPLPGNRVADTDRAVQFELVCGERRLRASSIAGRDSIPALVRSLTDDQALEIQLCENLKRDDLSALEEAEGYETLMTHAGINADQVAERIGKSRSYVYARIKLLDLCSEGRTSLRDGVIDASRALVIARIPDHKLQIKALAEIVAGNGYAYPQEPMSYREALDYVQQNFMLKLGHAKFEITNADLVPKAGSCKTCTKRTGHNPDLFKDVKSADVCTDPPCYRQKEEAHSANLVASAKAKGQTVIDGKESAELLIGSSYNEKFKGYRRLDSVDDSPTDQPLRKIIGPMMLAEGIKPVAIAHPRNKGELVECLTNETVLKLLKSVESQAADSTQTATEEVKKLVDDKKAKTQAKAKAQFEHEWRATLVRDTWRAMGPEVNAFNTDVDRYLAVRAARSLSTDNAAAICKLLNLGSVSPGSAVVEYAQATLNPELLILLIIMQEASGANEFAYGGHVPNEGLLLVAGNVFGRLLLDDVIAEIKDELKLKIWPKVAKKCLPATAPAARPEEGAGGVGPVVTLKPNARARAAKMTTEEATLGIAAAMQGIEGAASADAVALPAEPDEVAGAPHPENVLYQSPDGRTWSGRGQQPKWVQVHLENGGSLDDIKVQDPAPETGVDALILFANAVSIITRDQKASVRQLKTELGIGTSKAMSLMEQLEQDGYISACDERSARKVLVAS